MSQLATISFTSSYRHRHDPRVRSGLRRSADLRRSQIRLSGNQLPIDRGTLVSAGAILVRVEALALW